QLAAPLPDGTWVAATDSTAGSLLVRSDVVTPESGLPSAQVSVQADEGALTVTVTPPAVSGLSVGITLSESPSSSFDVRLDDFITDGSTTPHIYVLRRYATPPGTMYDGPLRSTTAYRVAVRTVQPSFRTGASAFAFGSPLVDTTAPPSPTGLTLSEPLRNYPTITLTPGDAPDVDHVLVCEEKGSAVPATPDDCIGRTDAGGSASVAPGAAAVDVPLTAVLDPGRYNPADERTFTAFTVDIQGNASAATSLTVPGASPTTSLGAVPGIEWAWDASTSSVLFRFRADPESAAIVAGTAPPATPAPPYGGLLSGRTWIAYNLVPGQTYTAAFYRWSSDSTHYTPTTVTFVAGTSSSDSATLIAPTTAAYAARPVIKVAVRRAVSSGTVGAASLAGMPVELWRRAAPSTTWVKIGTSTTGADGTASWTPSALGATSTFMALIPAQGYMYPSVVGSKAVVVGVRPIERASLSSSSTLLARSVRVGSTVPVTIRLAPRRTMVAWVQRYLSGRWRTVLITRTSSLGVLSYAFRPTSRGTTLLRVVTPATTTLLAGASNYVTVKAS
ncbi:MAG TPA: hypothetical protein VFL59_09375, partial [Candidatus Nanopelagicales bacterium]|nr:hypothetical protein [Candidatus Nanopelagicales bacterium]